MRAIVHLGMPKCGSSTIQAYLKANAAGLAAQGIAYDPACLPGYKGIAHQGIAICVNDAADKMTLAPTIQRGYQIFDREEQSAFVAKFEPYFKDMLAARREDVFIVSSEYLAASTKFKANAVAFHNWFLRFFDDVEYVLYFRRQEDWIASSWSERLKRGKKISLDRLVETAQSQNWNRMARMWSDAAGKDRMRIRLIERDVLKDGDLIADFCDVIGADHTRLQPVESQNESLSAPAAEILRAVNAVMDHTVEDGRRVNPDKVHLRQLLLDLPGDWPKIGLSDTQMATVRQRYEKSNARLCAEWFPDRKELFPLKATRGRVATKDEICHAAAVLLRMQAQPGGATSVADSVQAVAKMGQSILRGTR